MRRVDRVGPIDPADRDHPDRRRLALHHPDLHRARLAPEHRAVGQVEVVERVARRVRRRDVQGVEVVADVLDLRPPRHGEPEPAEDVDQLVGRLGQRVPVAEPGPRAGQGQVERVGRGRLRPLDPRLRRLPGRFERLLDGVEPLAVRLLVGRRDRLQPFLGRLDLALLLAQELDPRRLDGLGASPAARKAARPADSRASRSARASVRVSAGFMSGSGRVRDSSVAPTEQSAAGRRPGRRSRNGTPIIASTIKTTATV